MELRLRVVPGTRNLNELTRDVMNFARDRCVAVLYYYTVL